MAVAPARRPLISAPLAWGVQVFVLLMLMWLALDGAASAWLGATVALMGAAIGTWLVPGEVHRWRPMRFLGFCAWFVVASWRGGMDVAYRALAPTMPIAPVLHRHPMQLQAGLPRTVLVAVMSLLPGTLSVALEQDGTVLVVHCLTPSAVPGISLLERRVAHLFSVRLPEAAA